MLISRTRKKSLKNKFILSVIMLLLTVSCFITVSYAFFTNSAYSKGNKVFAGNLMVDVLIDEDELIDRLGDTYWDLYDYLQRFQYRRILSGGDSGYYYYASRIPATVNEQEIDTSILHIDNVEPGQAIRVKVNIVNSGDLALKAAGALRVDESNTGLETYINKYGAPNFTSEDNIPDDSNKSGYASIDKNTFLFNTLLNTQAIEDDTGDNNAITVGDKHFKDNGGHLEDALCVYLLEDVGDDNLNFDREVLNKTLDDLKQDERFFGTLRQFQYMLEYGANPSEDNKNKYMELWGINSNSTSSAVILGDIEADYQRYLDYASGYCLPLDEVIDQYGVIDSNFDVSIKDLDGNLLYVKEDVTEMDIINFLLYMPLEAGDEYQNASISLSLGATATQVEYEKDDLGYVIYDQSKVNPRNTAHEFTTVSYIAYGKSYSMRFPLLTKGTSISFASGEHASYENIPASIHLEEDVRSFDLTNDIYKPTTIEQGYMWTGFDYDSKTNTFMPITIELPKKGDLIEIREKQYRVLDINGDGSETKLLAMYDVDKMEYNESYNNSVYFNDNEELKGQKYEGSLVDNYLENTFYNSLRFKDAIVSKHITQNLYQENGTPADASYWGANYFYPSTKIDDVGIEIEICTVKKIGSTNSYERHVYLLDIEDVIDYLGTSWTPQEFNTLFFNTNRAFNGNWDKTAWFWLRSAVYYDYEYDGSTNSVWEGSGIWGYLSADGATAKEAVRPAFVINLPKVDFIKVEETYY